MQLSGGRHDLDVADDVDNGVATQHLSSDCKHMRQEIVRVLANPPAVSAGTENPFMDSNLQIPQNGKQEEVRVPSQGFHFYSMHATPNATDGNGRWKRSGSEFTDIFRQNDAGQSGGLRGESLENRPARAAPALLVHSLDACDLWSGGGP